MKRYREDAGVGQRHVARVLSIEQPILSYLEGEAFPMPRGYSARIVEIVDRIAAERGSTCWSPSPGVRGCGCIFNTARKADA